MHSLLYILKTLEAFYQGKHWTAKGINFYNEHQFFGKLYLASGESIDQVAELALANQTPDSYLSTTCITKEVFKLNNLIEATSTETDFLANLTKALKLENMLLSKIEELILTYSKDAAINNLLTTIAETHKGHVYLINRHFQ